MSKLLGLKDKVRVVRKVSNPEDLTGESDVEVGALCEVVGFSSELVEVRILHGKGRGDVVMVGFEDVALI
jgi:hypothetical protein